MLVFVEKQQGGPGWAALLFVCATCKWTSLLWENAAFCMVLRGYNRLWEFVCPSVKIALQRSDAERRIARSGYSSNMTPATPALISPATASTTIRG